MGEMKLHLVFYLSSARNFISFLFASKLLVQWSCGRPEVSLSHDLVALWLYWGTDYTCFWVTSEVLSGILGMGMKPVFICSLSLPLLACLLD